MKKNALVFLTLFLLIFTATYKGEPIETEDMQLRILEKIDGQWKIAFMGAVDISSYKAEEAAETEETAED